MRHQLLALCLSVLPIASAAMADDQWPEGSAMNVGGKEAARRDAAEAMLSKLEERLLEILSTPDASSPPLPPDTALVASLRNQQAAWRQYVPKECRVVGDLTGAGGSWPSTYAVRCEANLMELRVRRTRAALRCIGAIPEASRRLNQSRCLYQLAPLAVPLRP